MKFKGKFFDSFKNPPAPLGNPKPRMGYLPHSSAQSRLRRLRQCCRPLLNSTDPEIIERIRQAKEFRSGKFEEYAMLMMLFQSQEIAMDTGLEFKDVFDNLLDGLKKEEEMKAAESTAEPSAEGEQNG